MGESVNPAGRSGPSTSLLGTGLCASPRLLRPAAAARPRRGAKTARHPQRSPSPCQRTPIPYRNHAVSIFRNRSQKRPAQRGRRSAPVESRRLERTIGSAGIYISLQRVANVCETFHRNTLDPAELGAIGRNGRRSGRPRRRARVERGGTPGFQMDLKTCAVASSGKKGIAKALSSTLRHRMGVSNS